MKLKSVAFVISLSLIGLGACKDDEETNPTNSTNNLEGYTLMWADEFDGSTIDPANWTFETGDGTAYGLPQGWGNNELQIYTNSQENAYITTHQGEDVLAITAVKNGTDDYTSAKLTTQGLHSMLYGRVEIRAKVPEGQGLWPALWMLGENRSIVDWPGCGEIDIMEVLGNETAKMYTTLHFVKEENKKGELQAVHELTAAKFSDDYHVYGVEWTPLKIMFLLDGTVVYEEAITPYMKEFQRPFYAILNLAVGGFWPGEPDATTPFPSTLFVDYVRYYAIDNLNAPNPPALDPDEERLGPLLDTNLANALVKDGFTDFGNVDMTVYGGGGEPELRLSDTAVDGDFSLVYDFPGGSWGGAFVEMETAQNLSNYTNLHFTIKAPADLDDAEIKLEGPTQATSDIVMLKNYTPNVLANGFVEYIIPLNDFTNLDQTQVRIPFSMWNAVDANADYVKATIYIDHLYFDN